MLSIVACFPTHLPFEFSAVVSITHILRYVFPCSSFFFLLAMFKLLVILTNYSDIYFIAGFGTVAWVDVKEYETTQPDKVAVNGAEQSLKVPYLWYNDHRKLSYSFG